MNKLLLSSILLCLSFFSHAENKAISVGNPSPFPLSAAMQVDKTVYISGQVGLDPKTRQLVSADFAAQFKQALTNLREVAQTAGGDLGDVAKLTIYITDMQNYSLINEILPNYFKAPYPARSVIGVKSLPMNAIVEVEAIMGK